MTITLKEQYIDNERVKAHLNLIRKKDSSFNSIFKRKNKQQQQQQRGQPSGTNDKDVQQAFT